MRKNSFGLSFWLLSKKFDALKWADIICLS